MIENLYNAGCQRVLGLIEAGVRFPSLVEAGFFLASAHPAKLVEVKETTGTLYVRGIPVNRAGGEDVDDCRMEEWITLTDDSARIRFRFT